MNVLSLNYIFSVIIAGVVYYVLKPTWRKAFLLAISVLMYACANFIGLGFLFGTIISTFIAVRLMDKGVNRKPVLIVTGVFNFGILLLIKWTNYAFDVLKILTGGKVSFSAVEFLVPMGIAYYTLSAMAFVIDAFRNTGNEGICGTSYDKISFCDYCLYVMFFPHMLLGPIPRFSCFRENLRKRVSFEIDNVISGFEMMLLGYFKKLVLADRLGIFVDNAYSNVYSVSGGGTDCCFLLL